MQHRRRQATRLPHPWDSPGNNTGVGCHFLLQCMKVKRESEVAQSCPTLSDPVDCSPPGSSIHGIFQARALECGAIAFSASCVKPHEIMPSPQRRRKETQKEESLGSGRVKMTLSGFPSISEVNFGSRSLIKNIFMNSNQIVVPSY